MTPSTATFEDVMREHWEGIYRLGLRMLGAPDEAEELAQRTFFKAYCAWESFQGRAAVRTWLYRIAINTCRQYLLEKNKHRGVSLDQADLAEAKRSDESTDPEVRVNRALMNLAPQHRLILTLFFIKDLSHAEIAVIFDVPEGTVWSRLHAAKKQFAKQIQTDDQAPD